MGWWPFSWGKKRDPGDIAEAELLELVKGRLEMARIYIKNITGMVEKKHLKRQRLHQG